MAGRGRGKKAAAPRKKVNGYKMPAHIPEGELIYDPILKKTWKIGPSIGVGGFGEIYSACVHEGSKKGTDFDYVIKIEPHENGPLFVEKHFYVRNANQEDIKDFMKSKKLTTFGMPEFYGSGAHEFEGEKYRFLVLKRYGKDLWKIFNEADRSFSAPVVFQLGLQMLDILEYVQGRGYVHADLKGANILLGRERGTENQAFLVDFGLASKVSLDKEFKPNPKSAHDGTIEYTSRDAHMGGPTMRGDLEILAYNMLQWIVGKLPWEGLLKLPKTVQAMKIDFMDNVRSRITKDYPDVPDALIKFFEYITTLKPMDRVNYTKCRQIFEKYLKSEGRTRNSKLDLTAKQVKTKKAAGKIKHVADSNDDSEDDVPLKKLSPVRKKGKSKPKPSESDDENELPGEPQDKKDKKSQKRKSSEPVLLVNKVKRTKVHAKATPPARNKLANPATPGSLESPRRSKRLEPKPVKSISFDSPIQQIIDDSKPSKNGAGAINTSPDIFEDSFDEKKVTNKRKIYKHVTVETTVTVKKKTTTNKKGKSWRDAPTIVNGRCAPN